jgi:hypothetical protein
MVYIIPTKHKCNKCGAEGFQQKSTLCGKCVEEFLSQHVGRIIEVEPRETEPHTSRTKMEYL